MALIGSRLLGNFQPVELRLRRGNFAAAIKNWPLPTRLYAAGLLNWELGTAHRNGEVWLDAWPLLIL